MPWSIALSASIAVMLFCIYRRINIGATMLLGSTTLGLASGLSLPVFAKVLFDGLTNSITIMLVISILFLGILGYLLKATGAMEAIIVNLHALVADIRIIAAAIPALIGMLTVPGGAVLSAPLCAEAGDRLHIPPEKQAAINIWFRHVLYFMLPLFPSLILASQLAQISISRLVMLNLPLTIIGLAAGFLHLFQGYASKRAGLSFSWPRLFALLKSILPLLIVLILVVFFNLYFPLALLAGITAALLNYLPAAGMLETVLNRLKTMILPGLKFPVALVIIGIMIYKEMLEQTAVISNLAGLFLSLGVPLIVLIAGLSFTVGMLTGDNSAGVAILFPLFIPLLPAGEAVHAAYLAFLYAGCTAGHMISPAHPCFSLTGEYYRVDFKKIVVLILPLLAAVMVTGFFITASFGFY